MRTTEPPRQQRRWDEQASDTDMRLCYGLNFGRGWRNVDCFQDREGLSSRIKTAGTALVRIFVNPISVFTDGSWEECEILLDAVQRSGASPMIAVSCPEDWKSVSSVRKFANECGGFAARCADQWGQSEVLDWLWSIGDKPNSPWMNRGLTFEGYRDVYEATAQAIRRTLGSTVRQPRTGGPCIDGFQPFWFDWIWRFVEEIDASLVGFAAWNQYGDWREPGAWSAPADVEVFERLLLSRTAEYWSRAQAVGQLLEGRDVLNICSEINAHPHPDPAISGRFNQGIFGAVYYATALIELMRGGADAEFLWSDCYQIGWQNPLDPSGGTNLVYEAKKLIGQNVRFGDRLSFPLDDDPQPSLDAVVVHGEEQPRAAVLVYGSHGAFDVNLNRWPQFANFSKITTLSEAGGGTSSINKVSNILHLSDYAVMLLQTGEDA